MTLNRISVFAAVAAAAISLTPALSADATWGEIPNGWSSGGSAPQDYEFGTTQVEGISGKCAVIKATAASPSGFGDLGQEIAADNYHGRRLRLSAKIKTDHANRAQLWMRVDGPGRKVLAFYNMGTRPVTGTTDWKRYDVVLDVPSDALDIAFGYFLSGGGTAWARDFKLETVGRDVPVSAPSKKPTPKTPVNMDFKQ